MLFRCLFRLHLFLLFFFFNDTATTEIYTLSLHDALPILSPECSRKSGWCLRRVAKVSMPPSSGLMPQPRSEEHTSELQSPDHLVCRLLLEKKKNPHSFERPPDCIHGESFSSRSICDVSCL